MQMDVTMFYSFREQFQYQLQEESCHDPDADLRTTSCVNPGHEVKHTDGKKKGTGERKGEFQKPLGRLLDEK
jgi:hypothetical protein